MHMADTTQLAHSPAFGQPSASSPSLFLSSLPTCPFTPFGSLYLNRLVFSHLASAATLPSCTARQPSFAFHPRRSASRPTPELPASSCSNQEPQPAPDVSWPSSAPGQQDDSNTRLLDCLSQLLSVQSSPHAPPSCLSEREKEGDRGKVGRQCPSRQVTTPLPRRRRPTPAPCLTLLPTNPSLPLLLLSAGTTPRHPSGRNATPPAASPAYASGRLTPPRHARPPIR